ncbi:MAG TPA: hydantoinase/oxoprolinase family protein [Bacillota bacterium]|jgi:N-methylhydantoinase A/oxoprolinase/acetone carboxylase beta subunit|nr:hydantoinase/oxoprolinase family protein [Peptococcaceae bacterium MAG4]NLW38261.1 hydantoinase/oxoprolinase family protein [Peptococcaceae bacterium]HPZ42397.1 hydantoinase/oxoprolinase family protein [Bacillota bacterium]HQD75063.1 hydantoinase/oxoprolinase family protein [Bacillota bacterium]HUM57620.1 hydantoinase/oxoprolinase family protein [Bacillota bacterium]
MNVGVDVGGTFTDAVLLEDNKVRATAKVPTKKDLLESVLEAFDIVLKGVNTKELERIVFSTTMITNLIAERKYDNVAILLIPGPGLAHETYYFGTAVHILSGAIDYRGREIAPLNDREIESILADLSRLGYHRVCVVGKFSPRNTTHEKRVAEIIKKKYPDWKIDLGSLIGGQLNFPRRVTTTYLTSATREPYQHFINSVRQALAVRKIDADVFILKADGGTMPLENAEELPVETIFSGPAASTLGVQALIPPGETAVVVDIGGTTTDLALILSGQPLLSSKGAKVENQLTQVRTLAVKSVPVGGDSALQQVGNALVIGSGRLGPAYCMGGPAPTPTDALRVLGLTELGDPVKAEEAMTGLGKPLNLSAQDTARKVIEMVVERIASEVNNMFLDWEQEPAYRVWEVLQKKKVRPSLVAGVGGGASGFINQIAAKLGCDPYIPPYAPVANAIGAAVARPTMQVSLRADTEQNYYIIREEGFQDRLKDRHFNETKALALAKEKLIQRAAKYGLVVEAGEIEIIHREVFNMIRDWTTTGRLIDITVQTPRGITGRIEGGV